MNRIANATAVCLAAAASAAALEDLASHVRALKEERGTMLYSMILVVLGAATNDPQPVLKAHDIIAPDISGIKLGLTYEQLLAMRPNVRRDGEISESSSGTVYEFPLPKIETMKLSISYNIVALHVKTIMLIWIGDNTVLKDNKQMFFDFCWENFGTNFVPEALKKKEAEAPVPFLFWDRGEVVITANLRLDNLEDPKMGAFMVIIEPATPGKTIKEQMGGSKVDTETTESVFGKIGLPLKRTSQGLRYDPEPSAVAGSPDPATSPDR
ncbi:MAG: hypothetical protein HYV26_21910 [Candidatus Hydrogenedentes bacterium]|nr:hypothetical protein [Candidatus Hydrogenedentota bacterium]